MQTSPTWKPRAVLAIGIFCISLSALFVKWAAISGVTSAFYRVFFALLATITLWALRSRRFPELRSITVIGAGGLAFAAELVLWQTALLQTTAAHATLLVNVAPIWVGLIAAVVLGELQTPRFWLGTLLAFAGMAAVVLGRGTIAMGPTSRGDMLAAAGSLFYAVYLLVTRRARRATGTVEFMLISTVAATVAILLAALLRHERLTGFSGVQWSCLLALGLVTHFGGYLAISYALGYMEASRVAVALFGQPVLTAVLAWALIAEPIGPALLLGGALVLGGLYVALGHPRAPCAPAPGGVRPIRE